MADVTSAPATSEGTAQTAQSQPTSTPTSAPQSTPSTTSSTPVAPTTQASDTGSKTVNLFELEDFRKYQAQQEKRIAAERQQYQRQLAEMQQQIQQVRLQSAPEEERALIERDMLKQQLTQLTTEQQRQAALAQQWSDVQKLAEFGGMKAEDLWAQNFSNIGDAAFYVLENMTKKQQTDFEKAVEAEIAKRAQQREANAVDLGGGGAVTTEDIKKRKVEDAFKSKDPLAFMRALREQRSN